MEGNGGCVATISLLYNLLEQRHGVAMIFDLLAQFGLEFVRALLLDEFSERVRRHVNSFAHRRYQRQKARFDILLRRRATERLLHRLRTELDDRVR